MEEIENASNIFDNVENDVLAFILCIIILALYLINMFKTEIKDLFKNKQRKKKNISELKYHDVFSTIKRVVKIVEEMGVETSRNGEIEIDFVKIKVMNILISYKCKEIENTLTEFLTRDNLDSYNPNKLKFEVEKMLTNLVESYNKDVITELVSMGVKKTDAIYVVDAYEKFRNPTVKGFVERLESISLNPDYQTNYEKLTAILEVIALSLYLIPKDVEQVFKIINGRFLKYDKKDLIL